MATQRVRVGEVALVAQASPDWTLERGEVLAAAQAMAREGLVSGTSGNVSRRLADPADCQFMAITPSGIPYPALTLGDIVVVDFEGDPVLGEAIPSTETLTHAAIYQTRPDVGAVVHTHSTYASALAVAALEIPPIIDEALLLLGGPVRVAQHGFPSSPELAERAVAALGERNAVLLRNHGVVGVGPSIEKALQVCRLVEHLAHIYIIARTLGRARPLPSDVVQTEVELFLMRREAEGYPPSR